MLNTVSLVLDQGGNCLVLALVRFSHVNAIVLSKQALKSVLVNFFSTS